MNKCTIEIIEFHEPDLAAVVPHCVEPVAGMVLSGIRLKSQPNFEDVVTGCARLLQFKDARKARLERVIRFYFLARAMPVRFAGGAELTPARWLAMWNTDAAFQRAVRSDARYDAFCGRLAENFKKAQRLVLAVEENRTSRALIRGKIDPSAAAAMHHYMDEGGI